MPLPTAAEMRDRTKTNVQVRELLAQIAENAAEKNKELGSNNLNLVIIEGVYFQAASANATLTNNYPDFSVGKACVVRVIRLANSIAMQIIEADGKLGTRTTYTANSENPTWSSWVESINKNDIKSKSLSNENLNLILVEGTYFQIASANAILTNNYPDFSVGKPSVLRVIKFAETMLMQILEADGKVGTRVTYNATNSTPTWRTWSQGLNMTDKTELSAAISGAQAQFKKPLNFVVSGSQESVNYNKTTKTLSWATPLIAATTNATTSRISIAANSFAFSGAAFETLYLDLSKVPSDGNVTVASDCLKLGKYSDSDAIAFKDSINHLPIAQMTPQGILKPCVGMLFDIVSEAPKVDGFRYKKTATNLSVYLPAKNGNLINFNIPHINIPFDGSSPGSQSDLWRIERALEVDSSLTQVQEIATWGEIEFTMREKSFPADHVGGTHGDELLTSAFFIVDGVYKVQDFTVTGTQVAKEIRLEQISNVYRLNTQTPIALHKKSLTITSDCLIAQQEIEMLVTTEVDRFWAAMLTMRRKSVDELTQITKYDIRDSVMRDVSDTSFSKVYTPIKNNSSVLVCGDKYSGKVEISDIQGFLPTADSHVSNDAAYNKIYISAIGGASNGVLLEAGNKFSWMTKYKIDVT